MATNRVHGWDRQAMAPGRQRRSVTVVVLCRYCGLLAIANAGSSPLRPGPCTAERAPPPPIVWATLRPRPTMRLLWSRR